MSDKLEPVLQEIRRQLERLHLAEQERDEWKARAEAWATDLQGALNYIEELKRRNLELETMLEDNRKLIRQLVAIASPFAGRWLRRQVRKYLKGKSNELIK
jgi:histidinol dehydrogenase